ncbi:SAV_6107 family HEPN domain-containing protein [Streptosporangium sandarakinum]
MDDKADEETVLVHLADAHLCLAEAAMASSPAARYAAAHLAALRAVAAVLSARPQPMHGRRRLRSAWGLIPEVEPRLADWASRFEISETNWAALNAGKIPKVSKQEAIELMAQAKQFVSVVRVLLDLPDPLAPPITSVGSAALAAKDFPEPPRIARRFTKWAAVAAVEPERDEEWREALADIAAAGTRKEIVLFAAGILYAGLHSRVTWTARLAAKPAMTSLCWVLRSNIRTRMLVSALLLWAGIETAADTGPGAGIVVVLTGAGGLELVVKALRTRFRVQARDESQPPE